jgi:hypothetical protein
MGFAFTIDVTLDGMTIPALTTRQRQVFALRRSISPARGEPQPSGEGSPGGEVTAPPAPRQ